MYNFYPFNSDEVVATKDNKCVVKKNLIPPQILEDIKKDIAEVEGMSVDNIKIPLEDGFLCGYVCFSLDHIKKEVIVKIRDLNINAHGGITYTSLEPKPQRKKIKNFFGLCREYFKDWFHYKFVKSKYIVFGIDYAHAIDMEDKSTKSFEVVMDKCVEMEKSILEFNELYNIFEMNDLNKKEK